MVMINPHLKQKYPKTLRTYRILDKIYKIPAPQPQMSSGNNSINLKETEDTRLLLWNIMETAERDAEQSSPKNRMYGLLKVPPHPDRLGPKWIKGQKDLATYYLAISGENKSDQEKFSKHVHLLFKPNICDVIEKNEIIHADGVYECDYFYTRSTTADPSIRIVVCTCSDLYGVYGRIDIEGWNCAAAKLLTGAFSDFGYLFKANNLAAKTVAFEWLETWEMSEISYLTPKPPKSNNDQPSDDQPKYPRYEQAGSCSTCLANLPRFFFRN